MNKTEVEHWVDMALSARKVAEKRQEKHLQWLEERYKQMFFHAGRYAAGARDQKAVREYAAYMAFEDISDPSQA